MKKLLIISLISLGILACETTQPQRSIGFNVNIGSQPSWGPSGYQYVEYYYLPELDMYYHVPSHLFYYYSGGIWVSSYNLPVWYRNYDLYTGYKVVVNRPTPFYHSDYYRSRYPSYYRRQPQVTVRQHKEYYDNKEKGKIYKITHKHK